MSFAQDSINHTDDQGRKQGEWVKRFENGEIRYKGQFLNDEPVDTFRYYYPGGELLAETVHKGNGVSYTHMYHRNGKDRAIGKYLNEKRDSVWTFYKETGVLISMETYVNGEKHGLTKAFFSNGKLAERKEFVQGEESGKWTVFYEDGNKKMEGNLEGGEWNGAFIYYFPEGGMQFRGLYNKGLKKGIWYEYNDQGKLIRKEHYKNGDLINIEEVEE